MMLLVVFALNRRLDFDTWCIDICQEMETGINNNIIIINRNVCMIISSYLTAADT